MLQRIYFDANAGAPLLPAARDAAVAALQTMANASSVHAEGRHARALVETARAEVADAVSARPENVVFTSGATEAAALALTPRIMAGSELRFAGRLYVGATEHPCVLAGGRFPASDVETLAVERSGVVDLAALEGALAAHDVTRGVPYVALMLANNETGVIHPVAEAARIAKAHGAYVFCDAVQALGRIPVDIKALGVDFLALSAHKIGGPQGAGALVLADEAVRPEPLLTGGGQERRRRAGTENVAAIAGFGVAATLSRHHLSYAGRIAALRANLERELVAVSPEARIFGDGTERLPNTTLFAAPGLPAETAVIAFDLEGIAVSAGSACSSGKMAQSHVLQAMGETAARSGIRVSMTNSADEAEVDAFIAAWRAICARMRRMKAA
ncbi:MAG: cysteine desulfurase family protein [Propylenella sp.]